jgi:hypothetical protein
MNKPDTDWNLVIQARISISWLFESVQIKEPKFSDYLQQFKKKNEGCDIINPGILIAFAYIAFVYPKETSLDMIDVSELDFSKFSFRKDEGEVKPKAIVRRLRNSIAHGRYSIARDAKITFEDNCTCGKDPFTAEIACGDFGAFITSFCTKAKAEYFRKRGSSNK